MPGIIPTESRMDRAVASAYEPGSTFKVITLTGAIENGVATPERTRRLPDGPDSGGRAADPRLAAIRGAERAANSGAFKRCGRDQGRAAAGRAAILRRDPRVRDRAADGHRVAGRKSRPAAAARELVRQFDWLAGHGAGSERHAHSDHLRHFGDRQRRHALPAAHRPGNRWRRSAGAAAAGRRRSKRPMREPRRRCAT